MRPPPPHKKRKETLWHELCDTCGTVLVVVLPEGCPDAPYMSLSFITGPQGCAERWTGLLTMASTSLVYGKVPTVVAQALVPGEGTDKRAGPERATCSGQAWEVRAVNPPPHLPFTLRMRLCLAVPLCEQMVSCLPTGGANVRLRPGTSCHHHPTPPSRLPTPLALLKLPLQCRALPYP